MLTAIPTDGPDVLVDDEGRGPAILMIGPGLDDGSRGRKLAAILAERFRVLRLHRRQYRLDLGAASSPCTVADEVDDVLAVTRAVGKPVVVYGHSSGGVVALEALAAAPSTFAGAVIFEPAAVIDTPLGGDVIGPARAALTAGRPGKAMAIFTRHAVGLPPWQATLVGLLAALIPRYRKLVPHQLDDLQAMDQLGVRLDAYAQIDVPTVLLGGDRSPTHLADRLDAIAEAMPHTERVVMPNRNHGADVAAPKEVASVIETLATRVLPRPE